MRRRRIRRRKVYCRGSRSFKQFPFSGNFPTLLLMLLALPARMLLHFLNVSLFLCFWLCCCVLLLHQLSCGLFLVQRRSPFLIPRQTMQHFNCISVAITLPVQLEICHKSPHETPKRAHLKRRRMKVCCTLTRYRLDEW